ncbi:Galectin-4 [Frankliniella fusca]|uniref:Galectin-4 n=1 Tax=Frankliniella fusca TaxID=407009 RepID=A0AAE1LGB0_9NEOP|nr:Galectin-4 [Frankliniella fusca]
MVVASAGGATSKPSRNKSSTKSRASRASSRASKRAGGWYCCPCPLTAPAGPGGAVGRGTGEVWPAPAKFYCCRSDLVAAMARERSNNDERKVAKAADEDNSDAFVLDYEDDEDDTLDFEMAEEALADATFREVFDRSHQRDPDECWQVTEPDLPYIENLPHQLDAGRAIVVEGVVPPDAIGFAVNLSCGAGNEPDIAFHLNPRLDRNFVARNSRVKGSWGEEENAALGGSPFKRGQQFTIVILVSVNHMHFCNFQFRMPLSKVCRLEVHGDVIISAIKHTRLEVYPDRLLNALPEHTFVTIPTDHAVPWECNMTEKENLFIARFKPNLTSGMEITIKGRMKLLPQSFYINLQQGCQLWPHPNVHFHLNPRFAAEDSEHVVVVNGWMRGSWGSEQRYNRCRFRPGEPFTIVIYVEDQRYRVMVNGLQQAAMFHRAPASLVDTLVVRGDVYVSCVGISKSNPPVERLPSPGSPSESFIGSFVHIPETEITEPTLSPTSISSESAVVSEQSGPTNNEIQNFSNTSPSSLFGVRDRNEPTSPTEIMCKEEPCSESNKTESTCVENSNSSAVITGLGKEENIETFEETTTPSGSNSSGAPNIVVRSKKSKGKKT